MKISLYLKLRIFASNIRVSPFHSVQALLAIPRNNERDE